MIQKGLGVLLRRGGSRGQICTRKPITESVILLWAKLQDFCLIKDCMIEASDINRHNAPSASKTVIKHDRKSHAIVKSQHFLAGKSGCMLPVLPSSINGIYFSFFFLPLKAFFGTSLLDLMHTFCPSRLCTFPTLFWGYRINKCHCWNALPVQVSEMKTEAPTLFYWLWQIDSFWSALHFSLRVSEEREISHSTRCWASLNSKIL